MQLDGLRPLGLLLAVLMLFGAAMPNSNPMTASDVHPHSDAYLAYTDHDPIHINGDQEFHDMAVIEGWSGNGTASSPYIITGYRFIAAEHMFRVNQSGVHYVFTGNSLDGIAGIWCGIAVIDSANGTIANNIVRRAAVGIHVVHVENYIISGNEARDNIMYGVVVEHASNNVLVSYNTVTGNPDGGIYIGNPYDAHDSMNLEIASNTVYNNGGAGIEVLEAINCTIFNNTISNQGGNGIAVSSGSVRIDNNTVEACNNGVLVSGGNCTIVSSNLIWNRKGASIGTEYNSVMNNYVAHNSETGFRFYHSQFTGQSGSNNIIRNNTIANNTEWGMELSENCQANVITLNDFLCNGQGSHALDLGNSNDFHENFYDTWMTPNENGDAYVDLPYQVNGTAANSDALPLAMPSRTLPAWYSLPSPTSSGTGTGSAFPVVPVALAIGIGGLVVVVLFLKKMR